MPVEVLPPLTPDTPIWRYMDLPKFVSLLEGRLYFPRTDKLGDPYEGPFPSRYRDKGAYAEKRMGELREVAERMEAAVPPPPRDPSLPPPLPRDHPVHMRDIQRAYLRMQEAPGSDFQRHARAKVAAAMAQFGHVSCWHENPDESAALWEIYLKAGQGVAVRSTVEKLCGGLGAVSDADECKVFKVQYHNINLYDPTQAQDPCSALQVKRSSFAHEREVRAVLMPRITETWIGSIEAALAPRDIDLSLLYHLDLEASDLLGSRGCLPGGGLLPIDGPVDRLERLLPLIRDITPAGKSVPVPFAGLVEQVRLPPSATDHFKAVVESLCDRYGAGSVEVRRSEMDDPM